MISTIEHLPQGYTFWRALPLSGRKSGHTTRKNWAVQLYDSFFPPQFLTVLVLAAVDESGVPTAGSSGLYKWLVENIYHGDVHSFYVDWNSERRKLDARKSS